MKDIPGFEEYCATKDGRVFSKKTKIWMKQIEVGKGKYLSINLSFGEKGKRKKMMKSDKRITSQVTRITSQVNLVMVPDCDS